MRSLAIDGAAISLYGVPTDVLYTAGNYTSTSVQFDYIINGDMSVSMYARSQIILVSFKTYL
jgi:hypothetical protein